MRASVKPLGIGTPSAEDVCYRLVNKKGDEFGNCGANSWQDFTPCAPADVDCGLLLCQTGGDYLLDRKPSDNLFIGISKIFTNPWTPTTDCQSYIVTYNDRIPHPGFVKDGTPCGTDLACLNQHCVPVSDLTKHTCPIGPNGQQCSGNGVCNSDSGDCLCAVGYSGTACENHTG